MVDAVVTRGEETDEWLDALDSVEAFEGIGRVDEILDSVVTSARRKGARLPFAANTAYVNTIPPEAQPQHPGDRRIEMQIRRFVRWNAAAIVVKANKESSELGGHIASFQSAATLYDTGFMHFWHAPSETHGGDLIYFQGHSSPGIYARAFVEGRLSEEQLLHFRQEVGGKRPAVLPARVADAGFLAIRHRVNGARTHHGHPSGPLPTLPAWSRPRRHYPAQGLGLLRRWGNGRARVARRDLARRTRKAR